MNLFIKMCLSFLKIGAFSFGGGYAVLAFIQREVVDSNGWVSPEAFVDIVAVSNMTPGPIAVNSSTFVGYQLFGILGGIVCTLCVLAVPFLLSLTVSVYFDRFKDNKFMRRALSGIRPAVIGLIAASCVSIGKTSFVDWIGVVFFAGGLFLVWKLKMNPILVTVLAGGAGAAVYGFLLPMIGV